MIIDSHTHLNDKRLLPYVDEIVADMEKDNLKAIINVGYDRESTETSFDLACRYEKIYATVGIHPHDSNKATKGDYERFAQLSKHKKVVAIGEIGLDFFYDYSERDVQEKVFLEQMDLAYNLHMPMVLHLRDAYQLMYKLLKENMHKLEYGAVLHCYSGSKEMLLEFAKLNLYFSYGGAITFKNATEKPDIVRSTPIERLLIETDCPYMTPHPFRGKTNFPKYTNLVCDKLSEILNMDKDKLEDITVKNTERFFNLPR